MSAVQSSSSSVWNLFSTAASSVRDAISHPEVQKTAQCVQAVAKGGWWLAKGSANLAWEYGAKPLGQRVGKPLLQATGEVLLAPALLTAYEIGYNWWGMGASLKPQEKAAVQKLASVISDELIYPSLKKASFLALPVNAAVRRSIRIHIAHGIEEMAKKEAQAIVAKGGIPGDSAIDLAMSYAIKTIGPDLQGPKNRNRLLKSIAEYDKFTLLSDAIVAYRAKKKENPNATFEQLQTVIFEHLGAEKSAKLLSVVTDFVGPSVEEEQSLEYFLLNHTQAGMENKKKEILKNTFQPIATKIFNLSDWGIPLPFKGSIRDNLLPDLLLDHYRKAMTAPSLEEGLLDELKGVLYKGHSTADEAVLPEEELVEPILNSQEWEKLLWNKSGVAGAAEFLNNSLTAIAGDISSAVRGSLPALDKGKDGKLGDAGLILQQLLTGNREVVDCFGFMEKHIQVGLLQFLVSMAGGNIDDIRQEPNGKTSKALLGNLALKLSRLWDAHKQEFADEVALWRALPSGTSDAVKRDKFLKIFEGFVADLVKMGGVNPLKNVPVLSDEQKIEEWERIQKEVLPETFGNLYLSLSKWEAERAANEALLEKRSPYAVGAMPIFARKAVESAQSYLALNAASVAKDLKGVIASQFKEGESINNTKQHREAAKNARTYLEGNAQSFQNIVAQNLPPIAKEEPLWDTVESVIHPTLVKVTSELFNKLGAIEDKEGSLFLREISTDLLSLFGRHVTSINKATADAGKSGATEVDKAQMLENLAKINQSDRKGALQNPAYLSAKKAVFEAEKKVKELNNGYLLAMKSLQRAQQFFGVREGMLAKAADETKAKYENAIVELDIKKAEFLQVRKEVRGIPMAKRLLGLLNLDADHLPLPPGTSPEMKKMAWDLLVTQIVPSMLENLQATIWSKDTLNRGMTTALKQMNKSMKDSKTNTEDPILKAIRKRLKWISTHKNKEGCSVVAKEILEGIAAGKSLPKAVAEVLAVKSDAERNELKRAMNAGSGAPLQVRNRWDEITKPHRLDAEEEILRFDADNVVTQESKGFFLQLFEKLFGAKGLKGKEEKFNAIDSACGDVLKGILDLIPQGWTKHILAIHSIQKSASQVVGGIVREQLEQYTVQKIINEALCNAPSSLLSGQWEDVDGKKVFKATPMAQKEGYSKVFGMPLTPQAKLGASIKQIYDEHVAAEACKREECEAFSLQIKGIVNSVINSTWSHFLNWIDGIIDVCFGDKAPKIKEDLKKLITLCLDKLLAPLVVGTFLFISAPFRALFWFIVDRTYVSWRVAQFNEWRDLDYLHEEFGWDALDVFMTQFEAKAAQLGA